MNPITSSGFTIYPDDPDVFVTAAGWIQSALLGSIASTIAALAIATVGFLMLSGRLNVRRGATVILGCFILFGAATIAKGLLGIAGMHEEASGPYADAAPVVTPIDPALIAPPPAPPADPYAGAAFRR